MKQIKTIYRVLTLTLSGLPLLPLSMVALLFILLPALLPAQKTLSDKRQSYLAHIAAANAAMRLNDPVELHRWLQAAPEKERGWEWHFLQYNSDASIQTMRIEGEKPANLSVSPDGTTLALPLPNGTVELRDATSFALKNILSGHRATVYAAAFHPSGREVVTCSRDSVIRCFDADSGNLLWQTRSGGHGLARVAYSPDGITLAFASWIRQPGVGVRGLIRRLNAETGAEIWQTLIGVKPILALTFSPDGQYLAAANWDGQVWNWQLGALNMLYHTFSFDGCEGYTAVDDMAFSPDGTHLAVVSKCTTPRVWNLTTNQLAFELRGHHRPVMCVTYSRDGRYLYTAGDEGVINTWNAATGHLVTQQFGHQGQVFRMVALPDQQHLLTLSDDNTIRRWKINAGMAFRQPNGRADWVYAFDRSPDGKMLAMGAPDNEIALWDIGSDTVVSKMKGMVSAPNALAFSPDGWQLVAVNWDTIVPVWDTRTGAMVRSLEGLKGGSSGCAWSPDGRFIAAASRKNAVYVWNASTGQPAGQLPLGAGAYTVQFSPDGRYLAAAGHDGKITVWNVPVQAAAPWTTTSEWQAHQKGSTIYSLAFSPDGKRLVSGAEDHTAVISGFPSGRQLHQLNGHAQRIWAVSWSPNGKRVATAAADLNTCLWSPDDGVRMLTLPGKKQLYNLVFSSDGSILWGNEMNGNVQVMRAY